MPRYATLTDPPRELSGAFELNGYRYPANWLELVMPEELAERGIGVVVEATPAPEGQHIVSRSLQLVDGVPTEVAVYEPLPGPSLEDLRAYAREARWRTEEAGLMFDGFGLPTNAEGKFYIAGASAKALKDPTHTKRWQVGNDPITFTTFSNAQLLALGDALDTLVQATFDKLDEITPDIEGGVITTFAEIDAAFASVNRVFTSA